MYTLQRCYVKRATVAVFFNSVQRCRVSEAADTTRFELGQPHAKANLRQKVSRIGNRRQHLVAIRRDGHDMRRQTVWSWRSDLRDGALTEAGGQHQCV